MTANKQMNITIPGFMMLKADIVCFTVPGFPLLKEFQLRPLNLVSLVAVKRWHVRKSTFPEIPQQTYQIHGALSK